MFECFRKRVNGKLQRVLKRFQPVYHEYSFPIGISLFLGIILKIIDLKHELFASLVLSFNQLLHISSTSQIDHSSIISMSATILLTVLAIIFALLMFFTQTSYEYMIIDIFEEDNTRFLLVLYFATIVLSLMMLVTSFQYPIFLLTLTLVCIFSLYPFLHNISNKLIYEVGIAKLGSELPLQVYSNNEPSTRIKIMSISKICERSIKNNRLIAFSETMSIFEETTKAAKEKQMKNAIHAIGISYSNFLKLLIEDNSKISDRNSMISVMKTSIHTYVSDYSDTISSDHLITLLVEIPLNALIKRIKDSFEDDDLNSTTIILCYKLYSKLIKRGTHDRRTEVQVFEDLSELAKESYNHKLDRSLKMSIGALFEIGVKSSQGNEMQVYLSSLVIDKLKEIEEYIGYECFEEIYNDFEHVSHISYAFDERELKPYFAKFKELYDER